MMTSYFGEVQTGRLARWSFLMHWLGIAIAFFVIGTALVIAIGGIDKIGEERIVSTRAALHASHGVLAVIVAVGCYIGLLFAALNITAKRIRDTGLPGWTSLAAALFISWVAGWAISEAAGQTVTTVAWLGMLLIPSNQLNRRLDMST